LIYWKQITEEQVGIGQPNVNGTKLSLLIVPVAPLPEQRAIVSRIEQLFSDLDNGIANLRLAQEQLKVYRQAVLKKAFEGELTKKWREQQTDLSDALDLLEQIRKEREEAAKASGKKVKPVKPLTEDEIMELPGLPEGWGWVKFVEFCTIQRGYDLPLKNLIEGKYPVFTSGGLAGYHNEFKAIGPCLVTGRSGSVGNIHFLEVDEYWPHNTVLYVKDFHGNYPKYVYYFFLQFDFKSFSASTAVPTLDRKMLYNELVRLPPLPEQHAIVEEIETRLSVCDKMAQDIDEALEKAEALRQSILKKAFEGKLLSERELAEVRSAEDWEPAEVLLERIRVERAGNGKR
jgi:type I restriction enzyme S subunit